MFRPIFASHKRLICPNVLIITAVSLSIPMLGFAGDANAQLADCSRTSVGFIPLNELGVGLYQGEQGGLYPEGHNLSSLVHEVAGLTLAEAIVPLTAAGEPAPDDPNARYVLVSIGMSNTRLEFEAFKEMADADLEKAPQLVLVNGAQNGASAEKIVVPGARFWTEVDAKLSEAGVTPMQVAVAWVKEANAFPTDEFPADSGRLQGDLTGIAQIVKDRFPNLQLAYYSSRIYAGYSTTGKNPEPYAYQSGFAVKKMLEEQISGSAELNFDPAKGLVEAPWLAWGPYLWADGLVARIDGLNWACEDFDSDGLHPSEQGQQKVALRLLDFFKTDATARRWFLRD